MQSMIRLAADRSRLRKMRSGISACRLRASMTMNEARKTTAATSEASTLGVPHCEPPVAEAAALDRPYTSAASPTVPVTAPGRSNRPGRRCDSPSARRASSATTIPIGTLTNSTQRHDA